MFEINVTVNAPEIAEALNNLAAALKGAKPEPRRQQDGQSGQARARSPCGLYAAC